jgi:hypothetical protein
LPTLVAECLNSGGKPIVGGMTCLGGNIAGPFRARAREGLTE